MPCNLPGSSVQRILRAKTLYWVAIPFSRGFSNLGIESRSPAVQADSLPSEPQGKPIYINTGLGASMHFGIWFSPVFTEELKVLLAIHCANIYAL